MSTAQAAAPAADVTQTADPVATPATPATPAATDTLTRADVATMITEAVTAALAAQAVVRSETPATPAATETPAPAATPAAAAESELLVTLRSVQALGESVKSMAERVQSLEGATTVRSDGGDTKPAVRKDVFAGMFGSKTAA